MSVSVSLVPVACSLLAVSAARAQGTTPTETLDAGSAAVWSLAYTPDGRLLAAAGDNGMLQLWDVASGERIRELAGHDGTVRSAAFSPDGKTLVSAGFDHTIRLWDPSAGQCIATITDTAPVFFPAFAGDGRLVTGSEETAGRLWDLATGELVHRLEGHKDRAWSAAASPDGTVVAIGGRDGIVTLWSAATGALLRTLSVHTAAVTCVAFSPDGKALASGSSDNTVRVWDPTDGALLRTLAGHSSTVCDVGFSPDGLTISSVTGEGIVRLWDAETGLFRRALSGGGLSLAFSPDGSRLAAGGSDGKIRLLDWRHALDALRPADLVPDFERFGLQPYGQRSRNTCSVCTTRGVLEFAYSKRVGHGVRLSAEFLNWACNQVIGNTTDDRGQFFHDLLKGLGEHGICREDEMPYKPTFEPDYAPTEEAKASALRIRDEGFEVHWVNPLKREAGLSDEQFEEVKRALREGHPVAAGSGHSVMLVGYVEDGSEPGGGSFLIIDSGGPGHYYELSFEHVKQGIYDTYWVG